MDWVALLRALKEATKELPGMKPAWGVVILGLVAAMVVYVMGSGRAAVIAVIFAALGVIVIYVLMSLARLDEGRPLNLLQSNGLVLARTVTWALVVFIVLLFLVVVTGQPCRLGQLLGVPDTDCVVKLAGVHIQRVVNFNGSGCQNGERILREVVTDNLTFEGDVSDYVIQARKEMVETTKLSVQYKLDGSMVPVDVKWAPDFADSTRFLYPIPVNGKPATVWYSWEQRPEPKDDLFALVAVASSRPILSLHVTAKTPLGTSIKGGNPRYQDRIARMESVGCRLELSDPAKLDCAKPLNNEVNVPLMYPVLWDVFAQCEPKP
ncbi:hypothetical protein [Ideonella sp. B508-1]|uniref:hypothetical protein n=1 Tax=Ideonella sp. B508-1 TaxID=137716 RepID=UPI0003B6DDC0|nr:hypothetical protein [Ideonella sp. B508-1]